LPEADIAAWQASVDCSSMDAASRDLLLHHLAIVIASHPVLGDELVLRGGFALHRLVLPHPVRCCLSLEYARRSTTGIGAALDALREVAISTGFSIRTEVRARPRVYLSPLSSAAPGRERLRIDLETREIHPLRPQVRRHLTMSTHRFTGRAAVLTYDTEELLGLALRELYRRSRSRDLFDLWVGLTHLDVEDALVLSAFQHACLQADLGIVRRGMFVARLHRLARPAFTRDLQGLAAAEGCVFEPTRAASLITARLLDGLPA
jgi:predicted nucleotidyltransferase component of viral defense system